MRRLLVLQKAMRSFGRLTRGRYARQKRLLLVMMARKSSERMRIGPCQRLQRMTRLQGRRNSGRKRLGPQLPKQTAKTRKRMSWIPGPGSQTTSWPQVQKELLMFQTHHYEEQKMYQI